MLPKVSVIIPTYNYARFITKALDSVIAQTYPKDCIEIIVLDDGSTDNTREVLREYVDKHDIKYFYQENKGKAYATYQAIQQSTGKYIFNLDADDLYFEDKIEKTVKIFELDEEIVHVATPAKMLDEKTQIITEYEVLPDSILDQQLQGSWLLNYFIDHNILYGGGSTYAAKASVLKELFIPAGVDMYIDEFLILVILPHGKSFFIKQPLSIWRGHGFNYSENAKSTEAKIAKGKRLLRSSEAILNYFKQTGFDKHVTKVYELKYITSVISFEEGLNQKSLADICKYAFNVFFKLKLNMKILKHYHVYNRLLPTGFFNFVKRTFKN